MPAALGGLGALSVLDLRGCLQLKTLPETLGDLGALRMLLLAACGRLETLPETLGGMTSLETLDLHGCRFLEALPETLGGLVSLQVTLSILQCKLHLLETTFNKATRGKMMMRKLHGKLNCRAVSLFQLNHICMVLRFANT